MKFPTLSFGLLALLAAAVHGSQGVWLRIDLDEDSASNEGGGRERSGSSPKETLARLAFPATIIGPGAPVDVDVKAFANHLVSNIPSTIQDEEEHGESPPPPLIGRPGVHVRPITTVDEPPSKDDPEEKEEKDEKRPEPNFVSMHCVACDSCINGCVKNTRVHAVMNLPECIKKCSMKMRCVNCWSRTGDPGLPEKPWRPSDEWGERRRLAASSNAGGGRHYVDIAIAPRLDAVKTMFTYGLLRVPNSSSSSRPNANYTRSSYVLKQLLNAEPAPNWHALWEDHNLTWATIADVRVVGGGGGVPEEEQQLLSNADTNANATNTTDATDATADARRGIVYARRVDANTESQDQDQNRTNAEPNAAVLAELADKLAKAKAKAEEKQRVQAERLTKLLIEKYKKQKELQDIYHEVQEEHIREMNRHLAHELEKNSADLSEDAWPPCRFPCQSWQEACLYTLALPPVWLVCASLPYLMRACQECAW